MRQSQANLKNQANLQLYSTQGAVFVNAPRGKTPFEYGREEKPRLSLNLRAIGRIRLRLTREKVVALCSLYDWPVLLHRQIGLQIELLLLLLRRRPPAAGFG